MAQLRARYLASFPEKCALIVAALEAIPEHSGAKIDLRILCHKLAGSAPMYAFEQLGQAARAACAAIDDGASPDTVLKRVRTVIALLEVPEATE